MMMFQGSEETRTGEKVFAVSASPSRGKADRTTERERGSKRVQTTGRKCRQRSRGKTKLGLSA
jgi:hypothetical protein